MFEDVYVDASRSSSKKRYKQLQRLLSKYNEIKKFQEFNQDENLTLDQKKKINKSSNKKKILKRIHSELNRKLKPEETYEIWHLQGNLNLNLNKFNNQEVESRKVLEEIIKEDEFDIENKSEENDEEDDDEEDEDIHGTIAEYQLNKFTNSFDSSKNWTKANFLIRTRGLEVLPIESYGEVNNKSNVVKQHINNLKTLLHLNIMRRNWILAYKVFCLLIRLPYVDIRSIWPIGIEILTHRQTELEKESPQIQRFFEWLSSFHVINGTNVDNPNISSRKISAPIWRSGSKTHTPMYLVTHLWHLVKRKDYQGLKNRLDELLLEPPYNIDGVFYYLLVICNFSELVKLTKQYMSFDSGIDHGSGNSMSASEIYNRIQEIIHDIEKNLGICKELNFEYPDSIKDDLLFIMKLINDDFDDSPDDLDSSSEHEDIESNKESTPIELGEAEPLQYDDYDDEINLKGSYDEKDDVDDEDKYTGINSEVLDFEFDFD